MPCNAAKPVTFSSTSAREVVVLDRNVPRITASSKMYFVPLTAIFDGSIRAYVDRNHNILLVETAI